MAIEERSHATRPWWGERADDEHTTTIKFDVATGSEPGQGLTMNEVRQTLEEKWPQWVDWGQFHLLPAPVGELWIRGPLLTGIKWR